MRLPATSCLALLWLALAWGARAGGPEAEAGLEAFGFRTEETLLARRGVVGLDQTEGRLRAALGLKQSQGALRLVARGYVERGLSATGDRTSFVLRQGYAQYGVGEGFALRVGKQRLAWGSGLVWNPTARLEPPKDAFNPGLEQEGVWAVRADWVPNTWAGLTLVAAKSERLGGDALVGPGEQERRRAGALRARFAVRGLDAALVLSGGTRQPRLVGFDLARNLGGVIAAHAEGALYRCAELPPERCERTSTRLALGLLHTGFTNTSIALEYLWNGEGDGQRAFDLYVAGLEASSRAAADARLPPEERQAALRRYGQQAARASAGGLGLRRHYLQASCSRTGSDSRLGGTLRALVALDDGGLALVPGLHYAPGSRTTLELDALLLFGASRSEYGLYPVRAALQARLKVRFR